MNTIIGFGEDEQLLKRNIKPGKKYQFDGFRFKRILLTAELETEEDVKELIDFLYLSAPTLDKRSP